MFPHRLGYAVAILKRVTTEAGDRKLKVMYDVACRLRHQLENSGVSMDQVSLAVPVFHGYSHDAGCQVSSIQFNSFISDYIQPYLLVADQAANVDVCI